MSQATRSPRFQPLPESSRDKQAELVTAIRDRLIVGRLQPGDRLPRREELRREFQVSFSTLQQAINTLIADGFLEGRKRGGTLVAEHPPHLTRYGVVLPQAPTHPERWSLYWRALLWSVLAVPARPACQVVPYYVDWDGKPGADPGLLAAEAEVAARRVAGLIFAHIPILALTASGLMTTPGLPRVAVMSDRQMPGVDACLWFSYHSFMTQACARAAALGCRRVAVVGPVIPAADLDAAPADAGLSCPAEWRLHVSWQSVGDLRPRLAACFSQPPAACPEALIITDDNLLEDTCGVLLDLGLRVGHDIQVLSLWNLPNPPPTLLPVHLLAFDIRDLLRLGVEQLAALRRGQSVQSGQLLDAVALPLSRQQ